MKVALLVLSLCLVLHNACGFLGFVKKWKEAAEEHIAPKELKEKLEEHVEKVERVENWHEKYQKKIERPLHATWKPWIESEEQRMKEMWKEYKPMMRVRREMMRNKAGKVWFKFKGKADETLKEARNKMEMIEERLENGQEQQGPLRRLMKEIRVRTREIVKSLKGLMRTERNSGKRSEEKLQPTELTPVEETEPVYPTVLLEPVDPEIHTTEEPVELEEETEEAEIELPEKPVEPEIVRPENPVEPEVETPEKPIVEIAEPEEQVESYGQPVEPVEGEEEEEEEGNPEEGLYLTKENDDDDDEDENEEESEQEEKKTVKLPLNWRKWKKWEDREEKTKTIRSQ